MAKLKSEKTTPTPEEITKETSELEHKNDSSAPEEIIKGMVDLENKQDISESSDSNKGNEDDFEENRELGENNSNENTNTAVEEKISDLVLGVLRIYKDTEYVCVDPKGGVFSELSSICPLAIRYKNPFYKK